MALGAAAHMMAVCCPREAAKAGEEICRKTKSTAPPPRRMSRMLAIPRINKESRALLLAIIISLLSILSRRLCPWLCVTLPMCQMAAGWYAPVQWQESDQKRAVPRDQRSDKNHCNWRTRMPVGKKAGIHRKPVGKKAGRLASLQSHF